VYTDVTVDNGYRIQRIGYPFVAWLFSAGHASLVAGVLIGVNVAALTVLGWLGAVLAQDSGRHAAYGLLLVAFSGFVITLARDTAEILAACFTVGLVLFGSRRRLGAVTVGAGVVLLAAGGRRLARL
jgi:hypothetical protein